MIDLVIRNTNISMEWDDDGAVISSTLPIPCPRCQATVTAGVEHRCGNRLPKAKAKRTAVKRAL